MSFLQLEHQLLALSLVILLLIDVGAVPAAQLTSPFRDMNGVRPIGGSNGLEENDETPYEPTRGTGDGYLFDFDYELPDVRLPDRTSNKESIEHMLEQTHALNVIDARIAARVREELAKLLKHEGHKRSKAEKRFKRSKGNKKERRRAPYDFIVM